MKDDDIRKAFEEKYLECIGCIDDVRGSDFCRNDHATDCRESGFNGYRKDPEFYVGEIMKGFEERFPQFQFKNLVFKDNRYQSKSSNKYDSLALMATHVFTGYKSRDKEVSELTEKLKEANHSLRQYKKHVNKLMERYNVLDARDRKIEIQHHWFKNLIEWHKEILGVNDEV